MAGDHPADPALVELVVAALPVDPDDGTMVVGYDEGAPRSGIPPADTPAISGTSPNSARRRR